MLDEPFGQPTTLKGFGVQLRRAMGQWRRWLYPALLIIIYGTWLLYMFLSNSWILFRDYWPATLTMVLGSFVAGATAEGGGAVAFPIFTKVLQIPSTDARTFALMIQSFGMTMAAVIIVTRRVPILPRVITWVTMGGVVGQIIGTFYITIPNPYPKVIFTFVTSAFGAALVISTWVFKWSPLKGLPGWSNRYRAMFLLIGVAGGTYAAQVGSGIDILTFILLTLAFGVDEKISTPTTVIIMGLNSLVGFFLHGVVARDIGVVWNYWLVAVPVVIVGAPIGAYVASRVNRMGIIVFLLSLISIELATTLWLVPFKTMTQIAVTGIAVSVFAVWFWLMLRYRERVLRVRQ